MVSKPRANRARAARRAPAGAAAIVTGGGGVEGACEPNSARFERAPLFFGVMTLRSNLSKSIVQGSEPRANRAQAAGRAPAGAAAIVTGGGGMEGACEPNLTLTLSICWHRPRDRC